MEWAHRRGCRSPSEVGRARSKKTGEGKRRVQEQLAALAPALRRFDLAMRSKGKEGEAGWRFRAMMGEKGGARKRGSRLGLIGEIEQQRLPGLVAEAVERKKLAVRCRARDCNKAAVRNEGAGGKKEREQMRTASTRPVPRPSPYSSPRSSSRSSWSPRAGPPASRSTRAGTTGQVVLRRAPTAQ